jgi:calcineurin-like phosphoesterase family protein
MNYFTSDLHFYHKNIIKFCNRPYATVEEMNEALIYNWNKRVNTTDSIWVLGDFSFGTPEQTEEVLRQLKGHKHLIVGNHDRKGRAEKTNWSLFFNTIQEYTRLKIDGHKFVLCHFPFASWERGYVNLHGHTHGTAPQIFGRLDVGVDSHEWKPITSHEAYALAQKGEKAPY